MNNGRTAEAETAALDADAVALAAAEIAAPPWPREVPSQVEAEWVIAAALAARVSDADALATRVAAEISEIERSAFEGLALADAELLKDAAALRLRLATALATAPERGDFDDEAVQQLLASTDSVLTALAQESASAPVQVATAIGAIRTDLVRNAIRVSEAHQRLANPQGAPAAAVHANAAPQARLLSNESEDLPATRERSRRNAGLWVALFVAVLAAGGYHVNRAYQMKQATAAMIRVDGAPERVVAATETAAGQLLFTPQSAPLTEAELDQLLAAQKGRGRTVVQRAPGMYVIQRIAAPTESER